MPVLTLANVRHSYGTQVVLDGATLSVEPGEKVGLVGRNGSGKTTLMQVMRGRLEADTGIVQLQKGARVGYLSQDPEFQPEETLREAAEAAFVELHELHRTINAVFEEMAAAEGAALERLMKRQDQLEAAIGAAGGYAIDHRIDATLHGLGFRDEQFSLLASKLSGGQKGRLGLARLLLEAPDVLLLDEPTNHLDIVGRQWLEEFLAETYTGAVVLVTHDRWFLDRVVHRIIEIERGVIRDYPGNYHQYLDLRRERQMTQARVHGKQLDRIRQEEQFIARYKTGQRAKQARGRQSRLDRYKRDELVEHPFELQVMRLQLPKAPRSGDIVVTAEDLAKSYGELTLFSEISISIQRGERVGIIGPNGVGKTTLVRCLLGETQPDAGSVRFGTRLSIGYYRQLHEHLDLSLTVWQYLQSVIVGLDGQAMASEQQARDLAGAFLFSGAEQDKHLSDLSGGERSRAVLAGLVAAAHNLLVLDEPTNHLDIPSAERLEQSLSKEGGYDGTLILISHDRALLQSTCDRLIIFDAPGEVRQFQGAYSDWLHVQQRSGKTPEPVRDAPGKHTTVKRGRSTPAQQPVESSNPNPLARLSVSKLETRIEDIEARLTEIDALMLDSDVYTDGSRLKALQSERAALVSDLQSVEAEWSSRAELQ